MDTLATQISSVKICENGPWMIPCSRGLPTGSENGHALVIGIGGSTLRLTHVTIYAGSEAEKSSSVDIMSTSIIPEARSGNLFGWCAEQLVPHLANFGSTEGMILALSWSFPLLHGRIQTMGKSFTERYVGCDLLEEFNKELPRQFQIQSVTHDGLSSLIAGAHASPRCIMALTLGTGVNIAVIGPHSELVNTEISMLGRPDTTPNITLPTQRWDIVGAAANFQPFETQVGGLWLGPMASRALGQPITTMDLWKVLTTPHDPKYEMVDRIVTRAASLVASSLYGLALAFNPKQTAETSDAKTSSEPRIVAYTGGVIFESEFRTRLETALAELAAKFHFSLQLVPQRQGSEVGAAIAALTTK